MWEWYRAQSRVSFIENWGRRCSESPHNCWMAMSFMLTDDGNYFWSSRSLNGTDIMPWNERWYRETSRRLHQPASARMRPSSWDVWRHWKRCHRGGEFACNFRQVPTTVNYPRRLKSVRRSRRAIYSGTAVADSATACIIENYSATRNDSVVLHNETHSHESHTWYGIWSVFSSRNEASMSAVVIQNSLN